MQLAAYLERIGYDGPVRPDLPTLKAVHRAHLLAVPYENLDVQLGKSLTPDVGAAYGKIVEQRRGGWCYEMNGVLGWALGEIGFSVKRLCTGPMRAYAGERELGNHLVLLVELEGEQWLADVGFGDGPIEPYRAIEGEIVDRGFVYRLVDTGGGWLRLHNHPKGLSPTYDARLDYSDEATLATRCTWLHTSPESPFVANSVILRHSPEGHKNMIGRRYRTLSAQGHTSRLIADADDFVTTLKAEFGLDVPQAATLWPRICARHEELFGQPA